jgi:hypothetical protein
MCCMFFCTVKFSIKSFRVPELYIDVPETATVGSLKVLKRRVFSFLFSLAIIFYLAKKNEKELYCQGCTLQ